MCIKYDRIVMEFIRNFSCNINNLTKVNGIFDGIRNEGVFIGYNYKFFCQKGIIRFTIELCNLCKYSYALGMILSFCCIFFLIYFKLNF